MAELKTKTQAFAYPYGQSADFTPASRQISGESGYLVAFTTLRGFIEPGADALLLPRLGIPQDDGDFYWRLLDYLLPKWLHREVRRLERLVRNL